MASLAIELSHITKDFRPPFSVASLLAGGAFRPAPTRALDDVSFALEPGSVLGILGPNGAGKTTLLKIVATLILPDAGTCRVGGEVVGKDDLRVKSRIGLALCDERSFYWRLSGRQNLEFFAALYGLSRSAATARLAELYRLFDITYQDKRFDAYSAGMKRKCELARALIHDPEVLLLDEPAQTLDYSAARELRIAVGKLADRGKTILYATHDMHEAASVCGRFLVLHKGRVRSFGTLDGLGRQAGIPGAPLDEIYLRLAADA